MKTNIFLNAYSQPENKLTYSFISLLEYLNSKSVFEWLTNGNRQLRENPIYDIQTVYSGSERNPDGSFTLFQDNGDKFTLFLEIKSKRRGVDLDQLKGHLRVHASKNDLLLAITTNKSDRKYIKSLDDQRIINITWSEISRYLINVNRDPISIQFVRYGKMAGEFLADPEITKNELDAFITIQGNNTMGKVYSLFNNLTKNDEIIEAFPKVKSINYHNNWGREGIQINYENKVNRYKAWYFIGIYYDEEDHGINFKEDNIPELAFFIDIENTEHKNIIQNKDLMSEVYGLEKYDFEINEKGKVTSNLWRFLIYRKSINSLTELSEKSLVDFTKNVFSLLDLENNTNIKKMLFEY